MSVHVWADHIAKEGGGFEPQRQHNWTLVVGNLPGMDLVQLSLASGFLPRGGNDEVEVPFGNERVYVAGKAIWEAGSVVCRDYVDRDVAATLWRWRTQVYNPQTGQIGLARDYKKQGEIWLFGPNSIEGSAGYRTRVWVVRGMFPIAASWAAQGLDMASSQQVMIDITFRFDKALYGRTSSIPALSIGGTSATAV